MNEVVKFLANNREEVICFEDLRDRFAFDEKSFATFLEESKHKGYLNFQVLDGVYDIAIFDKKICVSLDVICEDSESNLDNKKCVNVVNIDTSENSLRLNDNNTIVSEPVKTTLNNCSLKVIFNEFCKKNDKYTYNILDYNEGEFRYKMFVISLKETTNPLFAFKIGVDLTTQNCFESNYSIRTSTLAPAVPTLDLNASDSMNIRKVLTTLLEIQIKDINKSNFSFSTLEKILDLYS